MITKLTLTDDITLVTVQNLNSDPSIIYKLFEKIAAEEINVDMISQTTPFNNKINVSFTVETKSFSKVLKLMGDFKDEMVQTNVYSGNAKLCFYGQALPESYGVAAEVLAIFAKNNIQVKMITTSEVDISVLIDAQIADEAYSISKRVFEI